MSSQPTDNFLLATTFVSQRTSGFENDICPMEVLGRQFDRDYDHEMYMRHSKNPDDTSLVETQGMQPPSAIERATYVSENLEKPYIATNINELCDWPQRLLHVPTMTSYEWQPGNLYAGVKEPRYRAISYTWGRWRVRDEQQTQVDVALQIKGVPWPIPRIKSEHFTPDQIQRAITVICDYPFEDDDPVQFLWLDLACIDQRGGPAAALEVGRQAAIFENASQVGAWLSHSGRNSADFDRLTNCFAELGQIFASQMGAFRLESPEVRSTISSGLREFLCDPWFTSLWTLQEAFLCPRAFFLSVDAEVFHRRTSDHTSTQALGKLVRKRNSDECPFTLRELATQCNLIARGAMPFLGESDNSQEIIQSFRENVASLALTSGLQSLANPEGSEMALFTSARYRRASRDEDHIYGIMQVFRYRLGKSRPGCERNSYTRSELADQLGQELLKDRPIQSQLHVFTEPVERGKGWRIGPSSYVPLTLITLIAHMSEHGCSTPPAAEKCVLRCENIAGTLYGHFSGAVCAFPVFCDGLDVLDAGYSAQAAERPGTRSPDPASHYKPPAEFYPDVSEHVLDSTEYRGPGNPISIPYWDSRRQKAFRDLLRAKFEHEAWLVVLHLGFCDAYAGRHHFGMLLLRVKVGEVRYWHRLGLVVWQVRFDFPQMTADLTPDEKGVLEGTGMHWSKMEGLFG